MRFRKIDNFGELNSPLRNIRFKVDGRALTADLIPEIVESESYDASDERDPILRRILSGGHLIVEGTQLLRLEFEYILAMAVDADTHSDMFGGLHSGWLSAPRLSKSRSFYPLLEIEDSKWKARLSEVVGPDNPNWRHLRMISGECSLDVLGEMPTGSWHPNRK